MAQPTSLLDSVRGIGRDFAIDELPRGFVWDLVDWIPNRRGAKLEQRGPWSYLTQGAQLPGEIWGGKHAPFRDGDKLLVCAGSKLYDHPKTLGTPAVVGDMFAVGLQNGVMLRDRCYFADGQGIQAPKYVTNTAGTLAIAQLGASAPKAKLVDSYRDRLIATADPAQPQRVSFSPLEIDGGPLGTWDALSFVDMSRPVTAFVPMTGQILTFHAKSIERIRGEIPPGTNIDSDMRIDPLSDQMGCDDPASICNWQENVIFANARGVHLVEPGSTIRSLTDQGSLGDFWRTLYSRKRSGTQVHCGVFLDYLIVTVLTNYTPVTAGEQLPITLICNLNDRTWFRFSNMYSTCMIESEFGGEELWLGLDKDFRMISFSPTFYGHLEIPEGGQPSPIYTDSIDGNSVPVLPIIDLGFKRLGPEGVKRFRHVYVSYQAQTPNFNTALNVLQMNFRMNVATERTGFTSMGQFPNELIYSRHRLNLGRRGYGVHLRLNQIAPTYLTRLYDISVDEWPQDRGKL